MFVKDQNGGSLIEFAIIGPLLLVILFGIIEFGILLYDKAMITNASREGARAGIVFRQSGRVSNDDIKEVVRSYCESHLLSFGTGTGLTIPDPVRSGTSAGSRLTVTVNYNFRFLVFSNLLSLIGGSMGDFVNISAVTVMRLE